MKKASRKYQLFLASMIVSPIIIGVLGYFMANNVSNGSLVLMGRIMLGVGVVWFWVFFIYWDKITMMILEMYHKKDVSHFEEMGFVPTYQFKDDWGFYYIDLQHAKFGCVRKYNPKSFQIIDANAFSSPIVKTGGVGRSSATNKVLVQILINGKPFNFDTMHIGDRTAKITSSIVQKGLDDADILVGYFSDLIDLKGE